MIEISNCGNLRFEKGFIPQFSVRALQKFNIFNSLGLELQEESLKTVSELDMTLIDISNLVISTKSISDGSMSLLNITHSIMERLETNAITNLSVKSLLLINNIIRTIRSRSITNVDVKQSFRFDNNTVESDFPREALEMTASGPVLIINNSFRSLESLALSRIRGKTNEENGKFPVIEFRSNEIFGYESGSLKFHNSFWEKQNVHLANLISNKDCHCDLLNLDFSDVMGNPQNYSNSKLHNVALQEFRDSLQCQTEDSVTAFDVFEDKEECMDYNDDTEGRGRTVEAGDLCQGTQMCQCDGNKVLCSCLNVKEEKVNKNEIDINYDNDQLGKSH